MAPSFRPEAGALTRTIGTVIMRASKRSRMATSGAFVPVARQEAAGGLDFGPLPSLLPDHRNYRVRAVTCGRPLQAIWAQSECHLESRCDEPQAFQTHDLP